MNKRHFTIIELLASMVIIMILVGLVMGGASVASKMARKNRCKAQITALEVILEQYHSDWDFYPEVYHYDSALTATWWSENLKSPDGDDYIDNTMLGLETDSTYGYVDPYGQPFYFQSEELTPVAVVEMMNPEKFDLWSKGQDNEHGEADGDPVNLPQAAKTGSARFSDDINNWTQN